MKNKSYEMVLLFDFYGGALTQKQQELFDLYYNEDLSLGEIAENEGITRQGVRDAVLRAETVLTELEQSLGLVKRYGRVERQAEGMLEACRELAGLNATRYFSNDISRLVDQIRSLAGPLAEEQGD